MDRTFKQKTNKEIKDLNNTIEQMYLTDIYRTFYLTTAEYTFSGTEHVISQNKSQQIQ